MDDSVFKQKYQKYKLRVKLWEKDFKKKHGRIPSKYDIREASKEIRDSYKMYYKLKTSFLEDTLNDVLAEDGFDVLQATQIEGADMSLDDSFCESVNGGPRLPLDISAITTDTTCGTEFSNLAELPNGIAALSNIVNLSDKHVIKEFEPVNGVQLALNEHAWGKNVSNKQSSKNQNDSIDSQRKPFKSNLNQKLFKSASFSKRNPRKSLSRLDSSLSFRGSQNNLTIDGQEQPREVLPDLETILAQKAKEQQQLEATAVPLASRSKETIKTNIDQGWLERNTTSNAMKNEDTRIVQNVNTTATVVTPARKQTYGLSNLDVTKILPNINNKPAIAAPELCMEINVAAPSLEHSKKEENVNKTVPKEVISSDSDAIVSNSEDEQESQEYRHIVKRRRVLVTDKSPNEPNLQVHNEAKVQLEPNLNLAKEQQDPSKKSDIFDIDSVQNAAELELGKDFSADEEKDADYEPEKPKVKRKRATAKRVKPTKKEPAASKVKKEAKPKPIKIKAAKKPPTRKSARGVSKENESVATEEVVDAEENRPLDPVDLKYALALDSGDITAVPRINLDDLEFADTVAQHYINTLPSVASNKAAALPALPVNEKRDAARKKLQEKIDSGKLNENFVTINIQKKTFVRGKKSMNFSKYKKKLWKHQKRVNALSGPNMNMGGCDGGVLTCFTCGQVGHFAQNCKIKGDSLLPLTAQLEEDPSPFPTLEEAELMATQSAVAVHSRNITKLPAAPNAAIYRSETDDDNDDNGVENVDDNVNETEVNAEEEDDLLMETDDELENMDLNAAQEEASSQHVSPIKKYVGHKIPEEFLKQAGLDASQTGSQSKYSGIGALYDLNSDGSVKAVTPEVLEVLRMFGHTDFRKGQDRAVMRILSGLSTLVTLSTGSGKSLCYQLPAYMYSRQMKSITLVISPLVSLMEDQVTGVPHFLRAHCLHTNQTPQQRLKIMQLISDGEIDILLVSPEAVVAGERSTGFGSILRQLPPIAFACIDEAHCVSQWSHNFRPSYLMICKVLKKNLGVKTVLGLTATATLPTRLSIINHLGIHDGESGIISDIPLPDNLILSISKDENRDAALLQLLNSERFEPCQSIIIYCTRRDECERIAGFIRTCMQDRKVAEPEGGKKKRKRINWHAEPYHAGMPSSRRRTIQNAFMKNELRIVVATIAFGMGINKPDIRSVIHYNMPRNFESYVQEIGRAGRDGKLAHCHLFLDARGGDQNELRRHIYANSIDRHVIRKLLQRIFVPCSCDKNLKKDDFSKLQQKAVSDETAQALELGSSVIETTSDASLARNHICPGHEIGFSIEKTVEALDIPAENISTLLCYMELDSRWNMNVLSSAYIMAKVISYGGPKYLKHAAKECAPLAMAIALEIKKKTFKDDCNIIEFSVVDIAAAIGWNSGVVKYQLKNLEWVQVNGYPKRSPISVAFNDLGFRIKAPGDFTTDEIDDALDTLYNRAVMQEKTQLIQLQYVFQGLSSVAYNTFAPCAKENFSHDRSDQLKAIIRDYFRNDYPKDLKLDVDFTTIPDDHITSDVHAMLNMYPDNNFSGRTLARIFHGISSPNYPAVMWGRCKYWRAHSKTDFNRIVQLANGVIVKLRT